MELEEKRGFPVAALVGAVIVVLLAVAVLVVTRERPPAATSATSRLPFGPTEEAYAGQFQFSDIQMSRATNLLNQELTFVQGVVKNGGTRGVQEIEVTVEFRDVLNQVVLRETRRLFGKASGRNELLRGGESRGFQLTFEHVPADWNRQYPAFRVSGLRFE